MGMLALGFCSTEDFRIRWSITVECTLISTIFQALYDEHTTGSCKLSYQKMSGFWNVLNLRVLEIKLGGQEFCN